MDFGTLSVEQLELWRRCEQLWELARSGEAAPVRAALHPAYVGWVTSSERPHDREAAVASIGPGSPRILDYELTPLAIQVFDGRAGVIHYSYTARVVAEEIEASPVAGRWTEVYLRDEAGEWIMLAVSGGPDGQR